MTRRGEAALVGVRVVELAGGIAGPIAGMLLADAGADVVKVEPVGGDPGRAEPGFAMWNRGKRSLRAPASALDALLERADVAIAGPEHSPDRLAAGHPRLVCLHVTPGVEWLGGGESHALLAAAGGVAMRQSSWEGGPVELVYPHVLYEQGIWAAACAVAALLERERSGAGQVVTVTGMHGVMLTSGAWLAMEPGAPPRITAVGPGGANPCYSRYAGSDGKWLFVGALTPKFKERALRVLGLPDLVDDERIGGDYDRMTLPGNREWVRQRITAAFATRPRDQWLAELAAVDCPAGPLGERDEWLDHPQVRAIGMRLEVDDPERGLVVMPGNPLTFEATPNRLGRAAPRLGEHDAAEIDWGPRHLDVPPTPPGGKKTAGPLAGLRVIDLGAILAGPLAGSLLAELGADVLKVEPPAGDSFREPGFMYSRGQRSLAIDLRDERGHRAFLELVRRADVVIDNYRPGVLERLRIDHESLQAVNPDIISLSITGYGPGGPLSSEPGFDPILQGRSGMMTAQGGDDEPVFHIIAVNDVAAAAFAALGACLALAARQRGGQHVTTSLAAISAFMQGGELVRFAGRLPAPVGGRDHRPGYVRVADGWVRALGDDSDRPGLSRAEAVAQLARTGVPAAPARTFEELRDDPWSLQSEFLHEHRRPDGSRYYTAGRFARFSRTERRDRLTAPGLGEHSREVLSEIGLAPAAIDALVEAGVVVCGETLSPRLFDYR